MGLFSESDIRWFRNPEGYYLLAILPVGITLGIGLSAILFDYSALVLTSGCCIASLIGFAILARALVFTVGIAPDRVVIRRMFSEIVFQARDVDHVVLEPLSRT